ncbi:putative repeat protein (TIGR01451 family)/gliding motility-associated-like protein [Chitinophaga sp. S165]|nr:putative repeat protein (TIGR01451 family)/gliding motility-associated-like protein [Chitinophaga sp. S165]
MRTNYNTTRLNLQKSMQQRVGMILTNIRKISDRSLLILLIMVGMTWLPAMANNTAAGKKVAVNGKPYTKSANIWVAYSYNGSGVGNAVKEGDNIEYRISIENTGDEALSNVRVVDTLPLHTEFYGASPGGTLNNNVLSWTGLTLAPGQKISVSATVTVKGPLTGVDYINNTGYVDIGDGAGLQHTWAPAVDNNINSAMGIDKGWPSTRASVDNGMNSISWLSALYNGTGPNGNIQSGDVITYTIHVQNTGDVALTSVLVTDYLPIGTTFVDATEQVVPDANNLLSWTIPLIDAGQSAVVSFRARLGAALTGIKAIENTAYVNNGNGKGAVATLPSMASNPNLPDPNGAGKPSSSIPIVSVVSFEGWMIVINESGEGTVSSGETLSYTIYIRNTGNTDIQTLQVSDNIPQQTTFVSIADGGLFLRGANTVNWAINNLPAGASPRQLHFKVKVDPLPDGIKSIDNTARLQIGGNSDSTSKATFHCDPQEPGCDKGTVTSIKTTGKAAGMVISNVVTPNGDGKNDFFYVRGIEKNPGSALTIFNRWGGVVYQNKDYQNSWNATGLSEGTYYYRLELNTPNDGVQVFKGWVMIIR